MYVTYSNTGVLRINLEDPSIQKLYTVVGVILPFGIWVNEFGNVYLLLLLLLLLLRQRMW